MPEPFSATAPLKSVKGTSTKPGVTFTGDENTGLYNPAPDELAVSLGGSEKAKFTGTGVNLDGDITLDDGGTYETTVQVVTPTADRTISFPDATGTVALVAGSSGQLTYNSSGAQAGLTSASIGSAGEINISLAGDDSTPPVSFTGSWFTGGTATTTKPQLLIEPTGTTSTSWDTDGTGIGVNAPSGFSGNLLDLQVNGSSFFKVDGGSFGSITTGGDLNLSQFSTIIFTSRTLINSPSVGGLAFGNNNGTSQVTIHGNEGNHILALRNSANAQTFRVYNTYSDASNYERGFLKWNSGVFEIGTEGAGTGSEQPVRITAATLNIPNLPTYADDAAAGTGGLVAGDVYKTATGELRIKL